MSRYHLSVLLLIMMVLSDEGFRLRRIAGNQELLSTLGIRTIRTASSSSLLQPTPTPKRRRDTFSKPVFDRSGHVITLPAPGEVQRMACVEIPGDRKLAKRIAEGEYQDCSHWAEGEARRRRFGFGRGGELEDDEPLEIGEVGSDFRWRKWGGLEKELREEMKKRGELIERDSRPVAPADIEPSAYSVSPTPPQTTSDQADTNPLS